MGYSGRRARLYIGIIKGVDVSFLCIVRNGCDRSIVFLLVREGVTMKGVLAHPFSGFFKGVEVAYLYFS